MWQILIDDGFVPFILINLIVIFSICIHELFHGLAALHQGDQTPIKTGHMTLNPLVHMGWESIVFLFVAGVAWGAMPVNPLKFRSAKWGEVLVFAAGPLSNLALSLLSIVLIKCFFTRNPDGLPIPSFALIILWLVALLNLKLFLLNMLPIPPLDGFGVFSKLFPALNSFKDSPYRFTVLMLILLSTFYSGLDTLASWFLSYATGVQLQ